MLNVSDNEFWTDLLRGNYSRRVSGTEKKKSIYLIDYKDASNNTFTVSNQLKVDAEKFRIADVVCFVNGIPLIVIEA